MGDVTNVVIRADASLSLGHGHVMRCLTLAEALRDRGVEVRFVCREHPGHLCDLIAERGFGVSRLPAPGKVFPDRAAHSGWLGATWQEDAEQTRSAIEATGPRPDWLVVDHYALDQRWEAFLHASATRVLVIDDLADRVHACDILLDQNLIGQMYQRYIGKVPEECGMLLGPEYALLQPLYADMHDRVSARKGPIRSIFIFFGGADSANLTGRSLAAFLRLNRPDIDAEVVVTAGGPHAETIRGQVASHCNIHLHSSLPSLAPVMAKADLAIGAGGATSWERLCMGLPSLVVTLAENQRAVAEELNRQSLIRWLGDISSMNEDILAEALGAVIREGLDGTWSARCLSAIDGHGVKRVSSVLTVNPTSMLSARHANAKDEALLLSWANDPVTRRNSFSSELIAPATHQTWLQRRLQDSESCKLYIVETTESLPLGQVRFERHEHEWELHFTVAPVFRGRGLGRPMLAVALQKFFGEGNGASVFARVKKNNQPSRKIFEALGFRVRSAGANEALEYRQRYDAGGDSLAGHRESCK